jgi:hypothetical protein
MDIIDNEMICDCENPEPESGAALVSETCPIHNDKPDTLAEADYEG